MLRAVILVTLMCAALPLVACRDQVRAFRERDLPALPIEVKYRDGLITNGYVLNLRNTTDKTLRVDVAITQGNGETQRFETMVSGNQVQEFGRLEGVTIASGDTILVSSGGYKSVKAKIP